MYTEQKRVAITFWGDLALWTIPGTQADPISQLLPPESAVTAVFSKIYRKPQFKYVVEKLFLHEIPSTVQLMVNEYKDFGHNEPQQRIQRCLFKPKYTAIARIELNKDQILPERRKDCNEAKYHAIFLESARTGNCIKGHPCMGRSDFIAYFESIPVQDALRMKNTINLPLGLAYFNIDKVTRKNPTFFYANVENGWVEYENAKKETLTCH